MRKHLIHNAFFDKIAAPNVPPRRLPAGEPIESAVHSLVADFQRIVRDWNGV